MFPLGNTDADVVIAPQSPRTYGWDTGSGSLPPPVTRQYKSTRKVPPPNKILLEMFFFHVTTENERL